MLHHLADGIIYLVNLVNIPKRMAIINATQAHKIRARKLLHFPIILMNSLSKARLLFSVLQVYPVY